MVGTVDDDFVNAEALHAAAQMLQAAGGLEVAGKRGELVRNDAYGPGFGGIRGESHDFGRGLALVARAEGTVFYKRWYGLRRPMSG